MSSLVLELQRDSLDPSIAVTTVVRKALVVATKLNVPEFRVLCEKELAGYGEGDTPPEYRKVHAEVKVWNPYHGWQPVVFENPEHHTVLTERHLYQSLAELEDLPPSGSTSTTLQMELPAELVSSLAKQTRFVQAGLVPTLLISASAIRGIVDRVRSLILEWSLQLEKDGILGSDMTFSDEERHAAATVVYNIQNVTGIVGGNVNADTLHITGYSSIHSQLKELGIDQSSRNEIETIMDELPKASPRKRGGLIQAGLDWVKRNREALGVLSVVLMRWIESQA